MPVRSVSHCRSDRVRLKVPTATLCVAAEPKLHVFSRGEHAYSSGSVFFPRWFLTRFLRSALCLLHTAVEVEQAVMVAALLDLIEERRWPKADNASA